MNDIRSSVYAKKVEQLLRLIPIVMEEEVFAIHGGTAINLFLKDLPRYSVDIDLTYIPLADRQTSLDDINMHLNVIAEKGIIGGDVQTIPLSEKAQEEFSLFCEASVVPLTQLYGGKIAAALSRQHPRDLFDVKYMDIPLSKCREGLIFCDRPIHESFAPSMIDQREAMENQFAGMTDIPFTYEVFEETRAKLISEVKSLMTEADKKFLISFESGQPEWDGYEFEYFKEYPSVQWKLLNLQKLAKQNPHKLREEAEELCKIILG